MPSAGRLRYLEALPRNPSSFAARPGAARGALNGTLVVIHGFSLGPRMWGPQLERAEHGWRVIAPQLRGFDGPAAQPAATSMADFAGDVIDLLDALHIE